MFASLLVTIACSEYNLTAQSTTPAAPDNVETPTATVDDDATEQPADDTDTAVIDEPVEEDTDVPDNDEPVETDECTGFIISEGFGHYENTTSYAIFSLIGDDEIEIRQGETAKLQLAVTAHKCGDIVFTGLTTVLSVIDYTPASWVTIVEHAGKNSVVTNLSGSAQFEPIDGYNCNSDDYDSQLFYQWETEVMNPNTRGAMDAVAIEAAKTEIFEFDFTPTENIPVGTSFDLYLIDPEWTDVGTGAEVWDTYYYSPSFDDYAVKVRITIVE